MILITGDAGFIGSYLVTELCRNNLAVRGIDMIPRHHALYPHTTGNILEKGAREQALNGADAVIHLAAEHKDFGVAKEEFYRVNVEGTKGLLECAAEHNVKKFIFFSSVAVYGGTAFPSEETEPRPVTHYGTSKLAAEQLVRRWAQEDPSRSAVIIRPTVVFGPRNRANIFKLIQYVCDRKFVWVGRGENVKSVAYVENLAAATLYLMERMRPGTELYNYVDEPQMNMSELVSLIAGKAGLPPPRVSIPLSVALPAVKLLDVIAAWTHSDFPISGDRIRKFNTSTRFQAQKIRDAGFVPPFSLEQGIEKNVQWYLHEFRSPKAPIYNSFEE